MVPGNLSFSPMVDAGFLNSFPTVPFGFLGGVPPTSRQGIFLVSCGGGGSTELASASNLMFCNCCFAIVVLQSLFGNCCFAIVVLQLFPNSALLIGFLLRLLRARELCTPPVGAGPAAHSVLSRVLEILLLVSLLADFFHGFLSSGRLLDLVSYCFEVPRQKNVLLIDLRACFFF